MIDIKARLTEAADYLDHLYEGARHIPEDLRHSPKVRGRVEDHNENTAALCFYGGLAEVILALSPASIPGIAQWLRTEAACNAGDEDHEATGCTVETCTALAALAVAENILKVKEKDGDGDS